MGRRIEVFIVVFMVLLSGLKITLAEDVPIVITPLNNDIPAVPGDTVIIPFEITNFGNETISNVTVYVTGPSEGFLYQSKLIRTPIPPNESIRDTISVKVLSVPPGTYNLTLVARTGRFYAQAQVRVRVGVLSDYSLSIDVGKKYLYGRDVVITLKVISKSNGIILGTVGYSVLHDGKVIEGDEVTTYLNPGEVWSKVIVLRKPPVGNYTVRLWANLGGKHRELVKSFIVYQRHLLYRAYFQNGAIHVLVYNSSGGVPGIRVTINGVEFMTNENGEVTYAVDRPGTYEVVLDLDGRIVTTFVEVKRLFISYTQENETLVVRVVDSNGVPVPNVTVVVSGPLDKEYTVTDSGGVAHIDLEKVGYGNILITAESDRYIGAKLLVTVNRPPTPTKTPTNSTSSTLTVPVYPNTTLPTTPSGGKGKLFPLLLILSGVILAGTSYLAFAVPIVHEETLDRYYFLKVRAPRLRPLKNYRVERAVNAVEVRATKGNSKLENGKLVWELDLEPGEEAYLQAVLG